MDNLFTDNNIYILSSYSAAFIVIVAMAVVSYWAKKKDENDLRKLERHRGSLSGSAERKQE